MNDCLQLTLLHDLHLNPCPGAVETRHQSTVDSFFFPWHQTSAEASVCTGILNHDRSHQATWKLLKSFGWGNLVTDINNKYLMINNGQLGQTVHELTDSKIYISIHLFRSKNYYFKLVQAYGTSVMLILLVPEMLKSFWTCQSFGLILKILSVRTIKYEAEISIFCQSEWNFVSQILRTDTFRHHCCPTKLSLARSQPHTKCDESNCCQKTM